MLISHIPYEEGTISHYSLKPLNVLWVFGRLNSVPVCRRPVGRSHCTGWNEHLKVPLVCHILTHFAWQLTNQNHRSMCWVCVPACVCTHVFTHPPAPPPLVELPKRLPGPYLICTHHSNLGLGWQAHFPHSAWSSTAAMPRNNQAPRVVL